MEPTSTLEAPNVSSNLKYAQVFKASTPGQDIPIPCVLHEACDFTASFPVPNREWWEVEPLRVARVAAGQELWYVRAVRRMEPPTSSQTAPGAPRQARLSRAFTINLATVQAIKQGVLKIAEVDTFFSGLGREDAGIILGDLVGKTPGHMRVSQNISMSSGSYELLCLVADDLGVKKSPLVNAILHQALLRKQEASKEASNV